MSPDRQDIVTGADAIAAFIRVAILLCLALVIVLNLAGMLYELAFEHHFPSLADVWATIFYGAILWAFRRPHRA